MNPLYITIVLVLSVDQLSLTRKDHYIIIMDINFRPIHVNVYTLNYFVY